MLEVLDFIARENYVTMHELFIVLNLYTVACKFVVVVKKFRKIYMESANNSLD